MTFSSEDLERFEWVIHDDDLFMSQGQSVDGSEILALVAEVRRLQAEATTSKAEWPEPVVRAAREAEARIHAAIARDDAAAGRSKLPTPAPLDTGRWVASLEAKVRRAINGDQKAAACFGLTPAPGESAEDFALRCWENLDPKGPPPDTGTGRWEKSGPPNFPEWWIADGDIGLYPPDRDDGWCLAGDGQTEITADDLEAAAAIIRNEEPS